MAASGAEPFRYAAEGIEYIIEVARTGQVGPTVTSIAPSELATRPPAGVRGRVFEVEGRVVERTREAYQPPGQSFSEILWTLILEGRDGGRVIVVKRGKASDLGEGAPTSAEPAGGRRVPVELGQHVRVRGVYLQQRTGTLGQTAVSQMPVLVGLKFRIELPAEEHLEPLASPDEASWDDVRDEVMRDSRKWDEPAVFEVLQWARERGYERILEDIRSGALPYEIWDRETFDRWKKEVAVESGEARTFTESARGKLYRTPGIIGDLSEVGWEHIPPNRWGVDKLYDLHLLSDHYREVALRVFSPFPLQVIDGVSGKRKEHLRIYGLFVKNYTYDSRHKREGGDEWHPITVPMFVMLHAEPVDEEASQREMRRLMLWVAGAMLLFGLLFYIVIVRGGRKQAERMEAHRARLRQRIREKGQGVQLPDKPKGDAVDADASSEDAEPS